jgi:hypothetical protein
MREAEYDDTLHVIGIASYGDFFEAPPGCTRTREEMMTIEKSKIDAYIEHVARYHEGREYLRRWRGR